MESGNDLIVYISAAFLTLILLLLPRNEPGYAWWKALITGALGLGVTFLCGFIANWLGGGTGAWFAMVLLAILVGLSIRFIMSLKWRDSLILGVLYVVMSFGLAVVAAVTS